MVAILEWLLNLVSTPAFWVILGLVALVLWGMVATIFKRVNIKRSQLLLICVIGLVLSMGGATWLGVGSIGGMDRLPAGSVQIAQLQTTTAYTLSGASSTDIVDSGTDTTRQSDFYGNETICAGNCYLAKGVFMVTRTGALTPTSCAVSVQKPARYDIADVTYHIVDENTNTGVMFAYVHTSATSAVATNAHPKEKNQLAFADGVAQGFVAFNITIDETGFDPLTQYDTKSINVDICGYPYTFVLHKADA